MPIILRLIATRLKLVQIPGFAVLVFLAATNSGLANTGSHNLCEAAAKQAAQETGVPFEVLSAITRAETGRSEQRPWPWTVNMEGRGIWFGSQSQALRYVFNHFKSGARVFDVGCFQINYKWHGASFSSIEEMFDPTENARYAAEFLRKLHDEFGDWPQAVGAYHSRTQKRAAAYLARLSRANRNLPVSFRKTRRLPQVTDHKPVPNRLEMNAGRARLGSLVSTRQTKGIRLLSQVGR